MAIVMIPKTIMATIHLSLPLMSLKNIKIDSTARIGSITTNCIFTLNVNQETDAKKNNSRNENPFTITLRQQYRNTVKKRFPSTSLVTPMLENTIMG